jgi:hypothetical protein
MYNWKPIEEIDFDHPLWVLKYDMFWGPDGQSCKADTPGAEKFTSIHGYYESQEEALEVQHHFPKPNSYNLEKIYKRVLLRNKPNPYSCAMCNGIPPKPGSPCGISTCPYKKG